MHRRLSPALVLLVFAFALAPAQAQDAKFSKQQLDQMLAPIALYPDDLLTNVIMASTYPLEVVDPSLVSGPGLVAARKDGHVAGGWRHDGMCRPRAEVPPAR